MDRMRKKHLLTEIISAVLSSPAVKDFARELGTRTGEGVFQFLKGINPEDIRRKGAEAFQNFMRRYPGKGSSPYEVLGLVDDAPREIVDAVYKAWAKIYHPDTGKEPDEEKMKMINRAYEEIKKKRGWS